MTTMEGRNITQKKWFNSNLISLKFLLFFFFGGMGCLFPFLPLHMLAAGLTVKEARIVSIVSPIVAMLGPLVAGPLADKLAGRQGSNNRASTGRYLRVMIAVVCILGATFYSILVTIPHKTLFVIPQDTVKPPIKFSCDHSKAVLFKEKCRTPSACFEWPEIHPGPIQLTNCNYICKPISPEPWSSEHFTTPMYQTTDNIDQTENIIPAVIPIEAELVDVPFDGNQLDVPSKDDTTELPIGRKRRYVHTENKPPHICVNEICYVYTNYSNNLIINVTIEQALNPTEISESCAYPISDEFSCRIPEELESAMLVRNSSCNIECDLYQPYDISGSVFAQTQCQGVVGDSEFTFWVYLVTRSIADIFPTTAVALLNAAVVIATRETSCGRGDVGRQLAFGSLGFALFGPLTGYLQSIISGLRASYSLSVDMFAAMMVISALIAVLSNGMPLSPPEWWWHTRSGMLALPMSAIKRYGSETAALIFVLVIMGIFWSAMDTFLPWHLGLLSGDTVLIGVCLTVGALPAIIFLWKSEHLVDYCGHSNLLMTAFTIYIVRFVGLSLVSGNPWWSLASESLELFTLGIMWVTAILYLRHLVPRHLTVTAQALPVVAHFCIGRCIGAVISSYVEEANTVVDSLRYVYKCMAVAAAVIALIYFSLYHAWLKPKCHAQSTHGPHQPPTIMQAMNGNGNYTPLRVYHNGRGRKGEFRY